MTRISYIPLLLIPWLTSGLWAQHHIIRGQIEHAHRGMVYLASYYGDRFTIADSVETSTGSYYFVLPGEAPAGIYRLIYPEVFQGVRTENRFVEFIANREDLGMNVVAGEKGPLPVFDNSLENQVYMDFVTFQLNYEASLMEVYGRLYPGRPGDPLYPSAVAVYEALQRERNRYLDSVSACYPDLYATRIMNAFRVPVIPGSLKHRERIDTLRKVFFQEAAIDDPALLHAPVYTYRVVEYLSLFKVDTLTMEQQEGQFIEAVDRIMANVSRDPELRSFVVNFLLEGFELLGMEQVQVHLADHYLDAICDSDIVEVVTSRMDPYRTMTAGTTAPDFVLRAVDGRSVRLYGLPHPHVLVMFWASSCEHCHELIPRLHEWYLEENEIGLEVVAISVDTLAAPFHDFIRQNEMPWITCRDPLGWYGKVVEEYHVYGTPMLFLLDRDRKVISKPLNFRQFKNAIRNLDAGSR